MVCYIGVYRLLRKPLLLLTRHRHRQAVQIPLPPQPRIYQLQAPATPFSSTGCSITGYPAASHSAPGLRISSLNCTPFPTAITLPTTPVLASVRVHVRTSASEPAAYAPEATVTPMLSRSRRHVACVCAASCVESKRYVGRARKSVSAPNERRRGVGGNTKEFSENANAGDAGESVGERFRSRPRVVGWREELRARG